MKLILTAAAAALIGTAALADNSSRYNDQRLDTAKTGTELTVGNRATVLDGSISTRAADPRLNTNMDDQADVTFATRNNAMTAGEGFLYGGFGPGNDSR